MTDDDQPISYDDLLRSIDHRYAKDYHPSLLEFTLRTKPDYIVAKPHYIICPWLNALVEGQIRRLMIFMPPRHGKSELVSRRLPAYFLGRFPNLNVIACSYSADLANRMNRDCQRIIDTDAYRSLFPGVELAKPGSHNRKAVRTDEFFEIVNRAGSYRSAGVGGGITGMGFDLGIIDDPLKNFEESHSQVIRDRIDEWYTSTFWTRQAPNARILLTMTRWHHDDIAGRLLKKMAEDPEADYWTVIRLPALADGDLHSGDKRKVGAPLWPERFPEPFMKSARASVGSYLFAGMYQQTPMPEGGNHFKLEWFNHRYREAGDYWILGDRRVSKSDCMVFVTCDPAASESKTADYTAIGVWAASPQNDLLLLDVVRDRFGVERIVPELWNVCRQWRAAWVGVEANGFQVSIVHEAQRKEGMPPIRELMHEGKGKLVRATPAIIRAESGKLFLPVDAKWVKAYIDELVRFTGLGDQQDDQVDMTAYAVWQMSRCAAGSSVSVEVEHSSIRPSLESNAAENNIGGRGR